ncbi:cytochrome c [Myxococcota bacterium]|nr:cytochrome c [Myxococcota bacterium]
MPRWPALLLLASLFACGEKDDDDSGTASDGGSADGGTLDGGGDGGTSDGGTGGTGDGGDTEQSGADLYDGKCQACHGTDGRGTADGPDLLREVENRDDEFLVTVILEGKGDMEPVDVTPAQAQRIVDYLHELLGV